MSKRTTVADRIATLKRDSREVEAAVARLSREARESESGGPLHKLARMHTRAIFGHKRRFLEIYEELRAIREELQAVSKSQQAK